MKRFHHLAALLCFFSAAVLPAAAVEAVQAINVRLTLLSQGPEAVRGNISTWKIIKSRITSKDVIQAIGEANDIQFGSGARLIQTTENFGQTNEVVSFVIREPGWEDFDVTEVFSADFSESNFVEASVLDRSRNVWIRYSEQETAALTIASREDTYIALFGLFRTNGKLVRIRMPAHILEGTVETVSSKVTGDLVELGQFTGVVDGSVGVGPAKLIR